MDTSTHSINTQGRTESNRSTASLSIKVVTAPDPKLRIETKPVKKVTPALSQTLKEMIKLTQSFKDPEGVGLASTQVGLDQSFFITLWTDPPTGSGQGDQKNDKKVFKAILNPKILKSSKKLKKFFEGCLSIPRIWGEIQRPIWVQVEYQDESGKLCQEKLTGLKAHIFQHEVDHLKGILFTQRVLEQKGKFYKWTGRDKTGQDIFEEIIL